MKKLGFGTMRLPVLNPEDAKSIDYDQVSQMVDLFLENGFTYFDTAYPYHGETSELAVRECLVKRYPRDAYVLADKMPILRIFKNSEYAYYFEDQLKKCGVDRFDYYLLHNVGRDRYDRTVEAGGFEFLRRVKEEKMADRVGFSFHDSPELLEEILEKYPFIDFVQLQINYLDWDSNVIASGRNYELCKKYGKPVVVMEPVKGGKLASLPEEAEAVLRRIDPKASIASYAIRFAASLDNVMMVLSGMSNLDQMKDNLSYMRDFRPLGDEEQAALREVTQILKASKEIPCTSCGYCMEVCPKNIHIPAYFGLYNQYQTVGSMSNMYYERAVKDHGKARDCIHCGLCEKNCPQHLPIRELLERFAELYREQEERFSS